MYFLSHPIAIAHCHGSGREITLFAVYSILQLSLFKLTVTHTCTHTPHACAQDYIHTHTHAHSHTRARLHTHTYAHTHTHMHTHTHREKDMVNLYNAVHVHNVTCSYSLPG